MGIMDHSQRGQVHVSVAVAILAVAAMLTFFAVAMPAAVIASGPVNTDTISGMVFFDTNGDGLVGPDPTERGIPAVTIQLLGVTPTLTTQTDANGVYTFTGLTAGSYTVVETIPTGYVTTTTTSKPVSVGSVPVSGINFGIAYPVNLFGVVCQDINPTDGMCGLASTEPRITGATVQVFDDANRNQLIDLGEATLAITTTNVQGLYRVSNLPPGSRIVLIRLPGGADSNVEPLSLESGEAGATTVLRNFAVPLGAVQGVVYNDVNGNEYLDAGEKPRKGAVVQLLAAAGGQAIAASVIATTTTGTDGKFAFSKVPVAAYQVQVVAASLPGGWLLSPDPAALIPALQANVTATLNIGSFDPQSAPPMSLADWKRELRQPGAWAYTAAELQAFSPTAEAVSRVFSETVPVRNALLLGSPAGVSADQWRAMKELAAVWYNLASLRLRPETRVSLGTLSMATTVRQARDEIEALILYGDTLMVASGMDGAEVRRNDPSGATGWAPRNVTPSQAAAYDRALAIAQALNAGKGVGAGLTGASAVIDAISRGVQVAPRLKPGGDIVEVKPDGPLTLRKWSPGAYRTTTNTLMAQARIRVKSFNEGGVLDVVQVFPDGRRLTIGVARSAVQNKDVNATYTFDLSRVTSVAELVNTTLILSTRDTDGGKPATVKVDSAEIIFQY